ncbi:guanine nucleotide exchange factor in Golgi transport N-terminal-domain-containing protein [Lentinula edodes]|uniref:guanine nucleotide exchange factor in Golgi transport N-terminal-domain-containing protein n=1 Tax=Lentinula edodes TaxID=5353 RepID=UPI001E8E2AC9|nr:guanine nucleotide exchange factor in Golgi transport N-terminal-domain-containing protein [Lentinula edodes]KAH7877661.1 guanine nucleotide exchange factor in Golgi transport N-terminal-domain-containing protein [Lentinula edodes]
MPLLIDPSAIIYSNTSNEATTFVQAINQYLCLTVTRNAISPVPQVFDISAEIFWRMLSGMRTKLKLAWFPFLAGLSGPLQETDDLEIVALCLDGFKSAMKIFTFLNNVGEMKTKNMEAIKALLDVAVADGKHFRGSWHEVLTWVSQLEHMQLISDGVDVPEKKGRPRKLPAEELANESRSTHITVAADMVFSLSDFLSGICCFSVHMRSGWRTMFGVFQAASKVLTERIPNSAFEIVTKLNRDHFSEIVRNGAFSDLVVCITDFCKVSKYQKISLLATGMLRGVIPVMLDSAECGWSTGPSSETNSSMDDGIVKYWYPILFAFYDIIMNGEDLEVRRLAVDSLFTTLKTYGDTYPLEFWDTSSQDLSRFSTQEDMSVWLSTTMIQALRDLIDLYTYHLTILERFLDGLLDLLCVCIGQENDTLARIGTLCLHQLLENNVSKLSPARWERSATTFVRLFKTMTPHQLFDETLREEIADSSSEIAEETNGQTILPAPLSEQKSSLSVCSNVQRRQGFTHWAMENGPQSFDLLKPVFMGCATKSPKVVAISLGSLQRLISLKAVPKSTVPEIIRIMGDAMNQGVDIQLKILQTLLGLITNYLEVHNTLLGNALLLCFKLQESRIAVVSSTATATLRQLVVVMMDKMVDEDHKNTDAEIGEADNRLAEITLPDGTTTPLSPSAKDAYSVFEDLCLLANLEKPNFLKLESLHKMFALELIESVLTNYHALFRKHPSLILLLQHHHCPLLLKALSDRPTFPLILRCTRVVFLLLKQFCLELQTEAEVFLMLLIGIITDDNSVSLDTSGSRSSIASNESYGHNLDEGACNGDNARNSSCSDAELMRNVWDRYDAQEHGSNALKTLITALKRLVTEKPALLGVGSQMFGVGVSSNNDSHYALSPSGSAYSLDGVVGMVATAASATVSNVVGMIGSNAGLSLQGSTMKLQCIDQLDKADSPPIPESYVYLLAVQCLVSLCEGFATFAAPLYNTIIIQKPCAASEAPIRAPPALDFTSLSSDDPSTKQLQIVRDIIESNCPALLAALSFVIATNLCDEIFVDILASYQAMTNVSGMLGLTTPRDAFFTSLAKFSVPTRVVSSLDSYTDPQTPRSATSFSENLGVYISWSF